LRKIPRFVFPRSADKEFLLLVRAQQQIEVVVANSISAYHVDLT